MEKGIEEAQNIMVEYAAQISDVIGVSDGVARMLALFYMSPVPVSIPVICERLSLTKGTVSLYLRLLEERGIIIRSHVKQASRQKFYEINPHLWRDLAEDMKKRHQKKFGIIEEAISKSVEALSVDEPSTLESQLARKLLLERLERFRMISQMTGKMISHFFGDDEKVHPEKEIIRRIKIE